MTDQPTPEALKARHPYSEEAGDITGKIISWIAEAISDYGSLEGSDRIYDKVALALDDFAQQARDRALEEVAIYIEDCVPHYSSSFITTIANRIRALKSKEPTT